VLSSTVSIVDSARDLGAVIDSRLTMSDQVTALCWAGYYQLHQLHPVARSLPEESAKTLVQAFISSCLDYCNALLYSISGSLFRGLQSIQNMAARFLTGASRRNHISPVFCSLHWLPVKQWVDYKLATLIYKSLRGQAPSYPVDNCQLIATSGHPVSLCSRQRSHCSENKHSTWRQEFLGCGSENLEQSTRLTAAA